MLKVLEFASYKITLRTCKDICAFLIRKNICSPSIKVKAISINKVSMHSTSTAKKKLRNIFPPSVERPDFSFYLTFVAYFI